MTMIEAKQLAAAGRRHTGKPRRFWHGALATLAWLAAMPAALADWNRNPEVIASHETWIYTPQSTMGNGKHGLLVVLHGCAQTNTELKDYGNLQPAAESNSLVLAVPYVGRNDQWGPGCWDFDRADDGHRHIAEIAGLTRTLLKRRSLKIDPDHVYVVGLSSGAALSLLLACAAPDLYAGIGAIAGPSVGSPQNQATTPAIGISDQNIPAATDRCRALAGDKSPFFATQIANLAYGQMDKDGPDAHYDVCLLSPPLSAWFCPPKHPGQYRLVSVKWSQDNAQALGSIYESDALDGSVSLQNGMATELSGKRNGAVRIGLLAIDAVGHAWPAGSGDTNGKGGDWIAQSGFNYPMYIAGWLLRNNRRSIQPSP